MAEGKKSAGSSSAQRTIAAYHEALTDAKLDERIGELAAKFGEWEAASLKRKQEFERLAAAERAAEESVVSAWNAALAAGAKPRALESIGLKPSAAIAAAKKRNGRGKSPAAGEGSAPSPAPSAVPAESSVTAVNEALAS